MDETNLQEKLFERVQEKGKQYLFCREQVTQRTARGEIDVVSIEGWLEQYRLGCQVLELMNFYLANFPEPRRFAEIIRRAKAGLEEGTGQQETWLSEYLSQQARKE